MQKSRPIHEMQQTGDENWQKSDDDNDRQIDGF